MSPPAVVLSHETSCFASDPGSFAIDGKPLSDLDPLTRGEDMSDTETMGLLEETFALTESAERWRARAEKAEAEVARLRRLVADPDIFRRAEDRAEVLGTWYHDIRRGHLRGGANRAMRYSRAQWRCQRIARGEPAFLWAGTEAAPFMGYA